MPTKSGIGKQHKIQESAERLTRSTHFTVEEVDPLEWVRGLSVMLRGDFQQLIDFVYFVYDMNGDKSLAREKLSHCLKGCMYMGYGVDADEIDECERDIVEIAMRKLDVDKDSQITEIDFQRACHMDPLLLQACGPCLPPDRSTAAFLALLTDKYRNFTQPYHRNWVGADKKRANAANDAANITSTTGFLEGVNSLVLS